MSKLRLWTWPSWPFAWPALSHFSPLKDVGLHVPMLWEFVINSLKNSGERRSKGPFLHKNPDRVNNRTLTVELRESSAEGYEGSGSQACVNSREGHLNVVSEFCDRGYYFSYYCDQMSIKQSCFDALFRGYCPAHQSCVSGTASAWCPWMLIPHITGNHEAQSACCYYPDGLFPFPSYLDWDPRTQDGATYIQNRSSSSVDSLWKDSSRHTTDIWLQLTWQI